MSANIRHSLLGQSVEQLQQTIVEHGTDPTGGSGSGVGVSPRMVTFCPDPIENVTMRGLTLNTKHH